MQAFIRPEQFNLLRFQAFKLIRARSTSHDQNVIQAVTSLVKEKTMGEFRHCSEEELSLIKPLFQVREEEQVEEVLSQLKLYVIPFRITEKEVKKLFPKTKKMKIPNLDTMDVRRRSYLTWRDPGAQKKYLVIMRNEKWIGIEGSFKKETQKGICTICNSYQSIGLFLVEIKGKEKGTYKKKGNYICSDGEVCNHNLSSLDYLYDFVDRLRK
ncbi:FBP C-terminal treble-clef zinc-finger [Halobacillus karajensis]|uniref:Fibronectin-binding protein (FBP) n=1 Tax=Halobacillus karajensis TaxID=195088 RepID=A0A024P7D8_9BACI|nr:elongation factor G-binding protein [Halobacillus karajensis]CDQ18219.1 Fibronectin-binding protein (FBP) [Halobacillus karajensis]CDQ24571.1 Fibronectin-binding protein (FBP) [Halobacillus karajensis]CDQ29182.1 Fibronectin-binding protein (FBP) [Halobacillus karajensis]SEH56982.1 FBP C-terminal treble-clef zinc-finger [Halobacillus karajensis]